MMFYPLKYKLNYDVRNDEKRIESEIFENDCYFPAFANDKVIVDVGACIGLFSMYAYPFAKIIYAIEAHPKNYANLVMNIEENKLDKIKPFNFAISSVDSDGWLKSDGILEGTTFSYNSGDFPVKGKTLTTFLDEEKIKHVDIMKMDIEGMELNILKTQELPSLIERIDRIIMEVHGTFTCPDGWKFTSYPGKIYLLEHK